MSRPSRRPGREGLKELKPARRRAARELRERRAAQGLKPAPTATIANGASPWKTVAEEKQARQEAVEEQLKIYRAVLPTLLERFGKIREPRQAKTIRHKLTVLLLYGILAFVFQMASRREANRDMTMPVFRENLRLLFPELESLPHQDTLNRLLSGLEVERIQDTLVELVRHLIRKKKFLRYLVANRYPIAIDGTRKMVRGWCWEEDCLERQVQHKEADGTVSSQPRYYVFPSPGTTCTCWKRAWPSPTG